MNTTSPLSALAIVALVLVLGPRLPQRRAQGQTSRAGRARDAGYAVAFRLAHTNAAHSRISGDPWI